MSAAELSVLRRDDPSLFKLEDCLTSPAIACLRHSIVTFVAGGWIRRWQQHRSGQPTLRYSFIVHTQTAKRAHEWQASIVRSIVEQLRDESIKDPALVRSLIDEARRDLDLSLSAAGLPIPNAGDLEAGSS